MGPNPTRTAAVLRIPGGSVVSDLTLLSISGQAVWQASGGLNGVVMIPMQQLPAGVYHLRVMGNNDVRVFKIIKE